MQTKDSPSLILIVDDDFDIRSLLADYLESNGFPAITAQDGMGMARMLAENKVDLVVKLQEVTGQRIRPEAFKAVRTVGDVVDCVEELLTVNAAARP